MRDRAPMFPLRRPCPCGSGERFKNCCEGTVYVDEERVRQAEAAAPGTISAMLAALDEEAAQRERTA